MVLDSCDPVASLNIQIDPVEGHWYSDYTGDFRSSLALTQVCRQMRKEFGLMQSRHYKVKVSQNLSLRYIQDFLLTRPEQAQDAEGTVLIFESRSRFIRIDRLMEVIADSPKIKLDFDLPFSYKSERKTFHDLFHSKTRNPTFWAFYKHKVARINLYLGVFYMILEVYIKPGSKEPWMSQAHTESGMHRLLQWTAEHNLSTMHVKFMV